MNKMSHTMHFNLSRGYLSKSVFMENNIGFDEEISTEILSQLPLTPNDKIECYHGCLPSGYTDSHMVFDYVIMHKIHDGYKPIVIKNGSHRWCHPSKIFDAYYNEEVSDEEYNKRFGVTDCDECEWDELKKTKKEFEHKYFGSSNYTINELLDLVSETSREKFHEFLEEKYKYISQEVLLF